MTLHTDTPLRHAAFNWLHEQVALHGDVLPRSLLTEGFYHNGERIIMLGTPGIWKPRAFTLPLSITTSINGPYDDSISKDNLLLYKYRADGPNHRDNIGLRELMKLQIPLIYFFIVSPGWCLTIWPIYIAGDDPKNLTFTVVVDDENLLNLDSHYSPDSPYVMADPAKQEIRRAYITSTMRTRLHQSTFRERVLKAYRNQCALCRLRHRELLEAAHIIPDSDPEGEPVISNGLSLCTLHHAAFDKNLIGITPDYTVQVRADILEEEDGPMLRHGLQGIHESKIILPGHKEERPDREFLARRYELFRKAV